MLEALESTLQCFLDFWKALVVALQGVTAGTYRIFYIAEQLLHTDPETRRSLAPVRHLEAGVL